MVYVAEKAIRPKSTLRSSLSWRLKLTRVIEAGTRLSVIEHETFAYDALGKYFDKSGEGDCSTRSWQIGDLPVICNNGASCHVPHSIHLPVGLLTVTAKLMQLYVMQAVRDTRSRVTVTSH